MIKPTFRIAAASRAGFKSKTDVDFAKRETLHEWEVPFEWPDDWPNTARTPFDVFHAARETMQHRMDQTNTDHADQETLSRSVRPREEDGLVVV